MNTQQDFQLYKHTLRSPKEHWLRRVIEYFEYFFPHVDDTCTMLSLI